MFCFVGARPPSSTGPGAQTFTPRRGCEITQSEAWEEEVLINKPNHFQRNRLFPNPGYLAVHTIASPSQTFCIQSKNLPLSVPNTCSSVRGGLTVSPLLSRQTRSRRGHLRRRLPRKDLARQPLPPALRTLVLDPFPSSAITIALFLTTLFSPTSNLGLPRIPTTITTPRRATASRA